MIAAKRQGIETILLEKILDSKQDFHEHGFYQDFANKYSPDPEGFNSDLDNDMQLKDMLVTKDLLFSQGVFSTPVFIVNGFIYNHESMKDIVEILIRQQFQTNIK